MHPFRLIALMATFNEERFIASSLEHLIRHGAEVYLIDNESTDRTLMIAEGFRGRGLIDISTAPRAAIFDWSGLLSMKERLSATLEADWFMHVDADEFCMPPRAGQSLVAALAAVDAQGDNVVNFREFTFVPTRGADHDHPYFERTMHWYYLHQPDHTTFMRAWKKQVGPIGLVASGGHQLQFPGLRLHPQLFSMRHYLFLSIDHAIRKYVQRQFSPAEVARGWHGWRVRLKSEAIQLPSQTELTWYAGDGQFDTSRPRTQHILANAVKLPTTRDTPQFGTSGPHTQHHRADAVELPATPDSRVVCIGGMHRSGTSMVARLLNLSGLYLGPDSEFMPANPHNQGGYWENNSFVALNEAILAHLNGGWDLPPSVPDGWHLQLALLPMCVQAAHIIQRFEAHDRWGWKDPRTSLTWPFWKYLLPGLKLIICLRNPLEVAESLRQRDNSSSTFGIKLWLDYNRQLLADVRPEDRIVTHYDSFFYDAKSELRRLAGLLQLPVTEADLERADAIVARPSRHQRATTEDLLRAGVSDEVFQLYCALFAEAGPVCQLAIANEPLMREAATPSATPADPHHLNVLRQAQLDSDRIRSQQALARLSEQLAEKDRSLAGLAKQLDENELMLARITRQFQLQAQAEATALRRRQEQSAQQLETINELNKQLRDRDAQIAQLQSGLDSREAHLAVIFASSSWRLSAPLRRLGRALTAIAGIPVLRTLQTWLRWRLYRLRPTPARDVVLRGQQFQGTGRHPLFNLHSVHGRLPTGWVLISVSIDCGTTPGDPPRATLYVDSDGNSATATPLPLPPFRAEQLQATLRLPDRLSALRLELSDAQGTFLLHEVVIRETGKVQLGWLLVWPKLKRLLLHPRRLLPTAVRAGQAVRRGGLAEWKYALVNRLDGPQTGGRIASLGMPASEAVAESSGGLG